MHGRVAAVEVLVKAGAALNDKDARGGYSPLHLAADAGQCEAITRLVQLGAPLETRSTKGWTPLALATLKAGPPARRRCPSFFPHRVLAVSALWQRLLNGLCGHSSLSPTAERMGYSLH